MKKNKFLFTLLAIITVVSIAACNRSNEPANNDSGAAEGDNNMQIALVSHSPESHLSDRSFNEGAHQGITRFLESQNLSADHFQFFQPNIDSDEARVDLIMDAVDWGADVIVLPGFQHSAALYTAQDMAPEVKFVILDGSPESVDGQSRIDDNVAALHYAEEQAGFLAGYAAVKEGYRQLGFMGGAAVPPVVRFGHGFIQGAEFAAAQLNLEAGAVSINYSYLGGFSATPEIATTASAWYASGVEVIFAAAGGAGSSVMSAAEGAGKSVIGVDVDQSGESSAVIFSAVKGLDSSVYQTLTAFAEGNFASGEIVFNAENNGIGLIDGNTDFKNLTEADLQAVLEKIAADEIAVSSSTELTDIDFKLVNLNQH